jgi:hypothetical protein
VKIIIKIVNPINNSFHSGNCKRRVKNDNRKQLKIKLSSKTPLKVYESMTLEKGSSKSPLVPNLTTIRKINSESLNNDRREVDDFYCVRKLNKTQRHYNNVKFLLEIPNYINIFFSKSQESILEKLQKYVLAIDASGSMIHHPSQYETKNFEINPEKFKPVYVYLGMLIDDNNTKSIPISQMISSDHSAEGTKTWMKIFLSIAKRPPYEVRIDASAMFMTALSQVFNQCDTKKYLENCYESIRLQKWTMNTMIRLDKSHVVKIFRNWKVWSESKCGGVVKKFYVDVLKSMISENDFQRLKIISENVALLMMSEFWSDELNNINSILHDYITHHSQIFPEEISNEDSTDNDLIIDGCEFEDDEGTSWIDEIFAKIEKDPARRKSEKCVVNPFYVPKFKTDMTRILRLSVMWTNVLLPFSPHNHKDVCTSSVVESQFNVIKNNIFSHLKLPIKTNKFMEQYLIHVNAQCILYNDHQKDSEENIENFEPKRARKENESAKKENQCKKLNF